MTHFVLICINEDYDIVSQSEFENEEDAVNEMKQEYERELAAFIRDFDDRDFIDHYCGEHGAGLVVGEEPFIYYWKILEINADQKDNN